MSTLFASASGGNPRRKDLQSMMPREAAFFKRTGQLYSAMKQRVGPKYWKSGRHKGALRVAGIALPFPLCDFQAWYQTQLGGTVDGTAKCAYCPRIITAIDASTDHVEPLKQGGSAGLENLALCCSECNRFKGSLTLNAFLLVKEFLCGAIFPNNQIAWNVAITITDAKDIERRLKGGIVYQKTKKAFAKKKPVEDEDF